MLECRSKTTIARESFQSVFEHHEFRSIRQERQQTVRRGEIARNEAQRSCNRIIGTENVRENRRRFLGFSRRALENGRTWWRDFASIRSRSVRLLEKCPGRVPLVLGRFVVVKNRRTKILTRRDLSNSPTAAENPRWTTVAATFSPFSFVSSVSSTCTREAPLRGEEKRGTRSRNGVLGFKMIGVELG